MVDSQLKTDNTLVWNGVQAPYYENYTFLLQDSQNGWSFLLRMSLSIAERRQSRQELIVQGVFCDAEGEILHLDKRVDLSQHEVLHQTPFMNVEDIVFNLAECQGSLSKDKDLISWEWTFEDPILSSRPDPTAFQGLSWPRLRRFHPILKGFATGNLFVKHRKFSFQRASIHQSHSFGSEVDQESFWCCAPEFQGESHGYFHALLSTDPWKGFRFPCFSAVQIGLDGEDFFIQPWQHLLHWGFPEHFLDDGLLEVKSRDYRFQIKADWSLGRSAALKALGPGRFESSLDLGFQNPLQILVSKKHGSQWKEYKTLASKNLFFEKSKWSQKTLQELQTSPEML